MIMVKYKKLHPDAKVPEKAYDELSLPDAGWDLFALEETLLLPGDVKRILTGLAIELPKGDYSNFYEAQIRSRSGLRAKGLVVPVGTIDAGYRGDIGCIMLNLSGKPYTIKRHEKICQMIIATLPQVWMQDVEELSEEDLSETPRGKNGFGSTGR